MAEKENERNKKVVHIHPCILIQHNTHQLREKGKEKGGGKGLCEGKGEGWNRDRGKHACKGSGRNS
jgi:hypothetical protein